MFICLFLTCDKNRHMYEKEKKEGFFLLPSICEGRESWKNVRWNNHARSIDLPRSYCWTKKNKILRRISKKPSLHAEFFLFFFFILLCIKNRADSWSTPKVTFWFPEEKKKKGEKTIFIYLPGVFNNFFLWGKMIKQFILIVYGVDEKISSKHL